MGKRKKIKQQDFREKVIASAGFKPGGGYEHFEGDSGILLNKQTKTVTLLENKKWKTYSYSDIREWETVKQHAGRMDTVGGGVTDVVNDMFSNIAAQQKALNNSGLFVVVRDIDNPRWRVMMQKETDQDRWMEIFRQEINES